MDKFFCGKCGMGCMIATPEELKEKILGQLTEEERKNVIWPKEEFKFNGSVFSPDLNNEIPFCEKCLTRIQNTEEIFCFDYVYLCPDCRKESDK